MLMERGHCKHCGDPIAYSAYHYCDKCSVELRKCYKCGSDGPKKEPEAEEKPAGEKKTDSGDKPVPSWVNDAIAVFEEVKKENQTEAARFAGFGRLSDFFLKKGDSCDYMIRNLKQGKISDKDALLSIWQWRRNVV